jgi:ribonuclease Z
MLNVTFLGTSGAVPSAHRAMPAIALKYDKLFLWDCGEGCQREMMRNRIGYGGVEAVFITHLHLDHVMGVFGLIETVRMNTERERITVFAPRGFERMLAGISPTVGWEPSFLDIREMREGELYRGKDYAISAFAVKHQRKEAYGLVFQEDCKNKFHEAKAKRLGLKGRMFREIQEKGKVKVGDKTVKLEDVSWVRKGRRVVYSGDTVYDEGIAKIAEGADLLIHESTFGDDLKDEAEMKGHSTAKEAATIAKKAKVKRLVLTHIGARYRGAELEAEAKDVFRNSVCAKDGMKIELKPEKEEKKK